VIADALSKYVIGAILNIPSPMSTPCTTWRRSA
jgi:hypothetical protein